MAHTSGARLVHILSLLICICSMSTPAVAARKDLNLTVYGFETRAGPNTTLLLAAGSGQGNLSAIGFGSFLVFDNILRAGPSNTSKELGRHQGTAVGVSLDPIAVGGVYMTAQHVFQSGSGQYNGSSIMVMGTVGNAYPPYILLIPGGLGYFFGCTGYAIWATVPATPPLFVFKWDFYMKCLDEVHGLDKIDFLSSS